MLDVQLCQNYVNFIPEFTCELLGLGPDTKFTWPALTNIWSHLMSVVCNNTQRPCSHEQICPDNKIFLIKITARRLQDHFAHASKQRLCKRLLITLVECNCCGCFVLHRIPDLLWRTAEVAKNPLTLDKRCLVVMATIRLVCEPSLPREMDLGAVQHSSSWQWRKKLQVSCKTMSDTHLF